MLSFVESLVLALLCGGLYVSGGDCLNMGERVRGSDCLIVVDHIAVGRVILTWEMLCQR